MERAWAIFGFVVNVLRRGWGSVILGIQDAVPLLWSEEVAQWYQMMVPYIASCDAPKETALVSAESQLGLHLMCVCAVGFPMRLCLVFKTSSR